MRLKKKTELMGPPLVFGSTCSPVSYRMHNITQVAVTIQREERLREHIIAHQLTGGAGAKYDEGDMSVHCSFLNPFRLQASVLYYLIIP